MTQPILYSQSQHEKVAEENEICRQIIVEINNLGFSQRQLLMIICLLAQELENFEHSRAITSLVRELGGNELLLIGRPNSEG